jgi:hypothetical protein
MRKEKTPAIGRGSQILNGGSMEPLQGTAGTLLQTGVKGWPADQPLLSAAVEPAQ